MARDPRVQARWAVIHALKLHKWDVHIAASKTRQSVAYVRRWKRHYLEFQNVNDKSRSGRPSKISATTRAAAGVLLAEEQSVPVVTAILKQQQLLDGNVHEKTVLRAVKDDMECVFVKRRPILNAASRAKRVKFCQQQHDISSLIASDSTYFTMGAVLYRRKYWTKKGTPAVAGKPNKSQQLHVYGGITAHGKTKLVFVTGTAGHAKEYYNSRGKLAGVGAEDSQDIMQNNLVPDAQQIGAAAGVQSFTWLIDNAPAHSAKSTKRFLSSNGIDYCKGWPPNSPDLNPLENVWAWMKQKVYSKHYNSLAEMKRAVLDTWAALPDSMCRNLMHSLQRRKAKCLERNGGHTGY